MGVMFLASSRRKRDSEVAYSLPVPPAAATDILTAAAYADPRLDIDVSGTRVHVRVRTPLIGYATTFAGWLEPGTSGDTRLRGHFVSGFVAGGWLGVAIVYSFAFCAVLLYVLVATWPPPPAALPFAVAVLVIVAAMSLSALTTRAYDRASRARLHAFLDGLRDAPVYKLRIEKRHRASSARLFTGKTFWIGVVLVFLALAKIDELTLGVYRYPLLAATIGFELVWLMLHRWFSSSH